MVRFWHWHIPTFIITDIFPPWWDFVMVGICRQAIVIIIIVVVIIIIDDDGDDNNDDDVDDVLVRSPADGVNMVELTSIQ